jgi:hypothetical protein
MISMRWIDHTAEHLEQFDCLALAASYGLTIERHELNTLIPLGTADRPAAADRLAAVIAAEGYRLREERKQRRRLATAAAEAKARNERRRQGCTDLRPNRKPAPGPRF